MTYDGLLAQAHFIVPGSVPPARFILLFFSLLYFMSLSHMIAFDTNHASRFSFFGS
jgi:hypothetical protein